VSRLASTALPVSLALASLCWPVAPALAGPTVKKLAWRTVAGTLETSWTGWRNTYGRTNLPVQRCDVPGQRFLVTEVRVTPTAFRGVAPGSPWTGISPEAAASLALW